MAGIQEVEQLLDKATIRQGANKLQEVELVEVVPLSEGATVVYGILPYQRRATGVPGRALIPELTEQPVLAVRHKDRITPLAYAEDVVTHPLSDRLAGVLEGLSLR